MRVVHSWLGPARRRRRAPGDGLRRLYVLAASALGLAMMISAIPGVQRVLAESPSDLNVDRLTARAYLEHYSPFTPEGAERSGLAKYGPTGNGHPPTTAFWALPLARMDARTAGATVAWISVMLVLLELVSILTLLGYPAPLVTAWLVLGFLLSSSFMTYHIGVGQISAIIGFLFFVAWAAGRRGDDWLAGGALGAACTMKMFPGLLVILFLVARRWRAAIAAVAVYVVVAIVMTARFGLHSWPQFFVQQGRIANQWMASIQNQSIHGVVLRFFWPVCGPSGPVLPVAAAISSVLSVALLSLCLWVVWGVVRARGFDLGFGLFVVLSMVTSQWTWEHYTIIYVLPVLILGAHLARSWRADHHRTGVAIMFGVLVGAVASWRISIYEKVTLQAAVRRGEVGNHLRLHLYDVLNWGPGFALLAVFLVACWWERAKVRPETERPNSVGALPFRRVPKVN